MAIFLRQSTASQEIPLGYFVDITDGNTEETALTIANTDIKLWKTGATTLANKNSGGGTHISNGIYYAVLDATDTDTIGPLVVFCHISATALPVRVECCVLDEAVYDVIFGTTALSTYAGGAVASVTGAVGSVTGAVGSVTAGVTLANGAVTNASLAGNMEIVFETDFATNYNTTTDKWQVETASGSTGLLTSGTAAAIADGTITLASGHGITDTTVLIVLDGGTNAVGKSRKATYSGTGDVFNVDPDWNATIDGNAETTPSGTITYEVWPYAPVGTDYPVNAAVVTWNGVALGTTNPLPNAAAGGNGGLPTVNASNYIAGVQGTLNTLDALDTAQDSQHSTTQGLVTTVDTVVDGIQTDLSNATDGLGAIKTAVDAVPTVSEILTTQMTESYAADGAAPTLAQSLMLIQQMLGDFTISGTTLTVRQVDGTTTAATFTLNDGTTPTALTRAT